MAGSYASPIDDYDEGTRQTQSKLRNEFVMATDSQTFQSPLIACAASFYAHVLFDKEYHVEESRLQRLAWFRRKQELHFVHHRHANSNFAVIHFFWDRILGTYRRPEAGA
jgi:sterol desaturase/sphingolipid hydroxylase (fatty acid hydroxylase superfamily)